MARSYLIDPHTGNVKYLGAISVVPEPAATTVALAGLGGLLMRRRSRSRSAG
jgi:MYXO-CTERM domain-containing protein